MFFCKKLGRTKFIFDTPMEAPSLEMMLLPPFYPVIGGQLTFPKGHVFTIPKRSPAELPGEIFFIFFSPQNATKNKKDVTNSRGDCRFFLGHFPPSKKNIIHLVR